jgi:hypothetical protein
MDIEDNATWDRSNGIPDYFANTPLRGEVYTNEVKDTSRREVFVVEAATNARVGWRRRRGRLGLCSGGGLVSMGSTRCGSFWKVVLIFRCPSRITIPGDLCNISCTLA